MFYSHIIKIESLVESLEELELSDLQKKDLAYLIDSTIHHTILELVLSKLSLEDQRVFVNLLHKKERGEKVMEFLGTKIENIEEEIDNVSQKLKKELHQDIAEAKRIKK